MLQAIRKSIRRISKLLSASHLKIFYYYEYFGSVYSSQQTVQFELGKFDIILKKLMEEGFVGKHDILTSPRLSDEDILLAHTKKYLYALKNPLEVGRILNLDFVNMWDHHIFDYFRHVAGGTVKGLQMAFTKGVNVVNLGGGYHHAHRDRGEGFCLINDVAIAILKLRKTYPDCRCLIVDLDYHQSNGIIEYFEGDNQTFILTIQAANWLEVNAQNITNIKISSDISYSQYEDILVNELHHIKSQFNPDVIIYLAGSDVAESDLLTDMHLHEADLLNRDKIIYNFAGDIQVPVLVLAAGGYGPDSWKYYYNFIKWMITHPHKVRKNDI